MCDYDHRLPRGEKCQRDAVIFWNPTHLAWFTVDGPVFWLPGAGGNNRQEADQFGSDAIWPAFGVLAVFGPV